MIQTINGWRAVFALMIVLFHVGATSFEEMTWAGVTFFLMASGFLMARKYPFEQLDGQSYRPFAWNHAAKLFPLHWLTLVLWLVAMALLGMLAIKPVALALNATLLHSWSLTHSIYFSYNKFSWFLSTLLFCYLCYPLLARRFTPLPQPIKWLILGVLVIIDILILAGTDDYGRTAFYVFPPVRLLDFVIGMALAQACQENKKIQLLGKSSTGIDAELISLAVLSAGEWLGNISFEIFMLQGIAALVYNYWVAPVLAHIGLQRVYDYVAADLLGASAPGLIVWLILPIDILLAWGVNRLFTRPVARLLRRS